MEKDSRPQQTFLFLEKSGLTMGRGMYRHPPAESSTNTQSKLERVDWMIGLWGAKERVCDVFRILLFGFVLLYLLAVGLFVRIIVGDERDDCFQ